jgi:drug/metabolite transporter (DMT)-like permease
MSSAAAVGPGLGFIGLGLAASLFWGASDFLGGLATRKAHVVGVVAVAHGISLGLLLLAALATHSPLPPQRFVLLGLCAGTVGGVALILYYQALSLGEMGITTALTGLLTALIPVVRSSPRARLSPPRSPASCWRPPRSRSLPTRRQDCLAPWPSD